MHKIVNKYGNTVLYDSSIWSMTVQFTISQFWTKNNK
jgi:hypothetical protein